MYFTQADGVSVHTGFPNPAADASLQTLDFNQLLIHNHAATYVMRISGNDWAEQGIFDGDFVLIDRALVAKPNDVVAWIRDDLFALSPKHAVPAGGAVWGVATSVIHPFRLKNLEKL